MTTQNSNNTKITNNADGFDQAGGTTPRKLNVTGADITLTGSGTAVHTFPTTTSTLARTDAAQNFTGVQTFNSTIELGHATDTTLSRTAAGEIAVEGVRIKTTTPKLVSAASYTTDTGTSLNMDNLDQFIVTAQAGALLFNEPGGTKYDGQKLIIAVTGTAARALTWNAVFEASTVALPTTTVTTARLNMGFIWRADTSKWVILTSA